MTAIQAAQKKLAEMREQGFKSVVLNPIDKAKANPTSQKYAIRAHCWECVGGDGNENPKVLVRDCGLKDKCSLWPHRPWQDVK
jgi:hypothetical protein